MREDELFSGTNTKEISQIISPEFLLVLLRAYRFLDEKEKTLKCLPSPDKELDLRAKRIGKNLRQILVQLKNLRTDGYLSADGFVRAILCLAGEFGQGSMWQDFYLGYRLRNPRGGPSRNLALKSLVVCLVEYAKLKTGRPHYELIERFLSENDIRKDADSKDVDSGVSKIWSRTTEKTRAELRILIFVAAFPEFQSVLIPSHAKKYADLSDFCSLALKTL